MTMCILLRRSALICLLCIFCRQNGITQTQSSIGDKAAPTFRIATNLVLVNVVALNTATRAPIGTLRREDFVLFDNDHQVQIKTFDAGSAAQPLAVWFLVQCTMPGWDENGSGTFRGRLSQFEREVKDPNGRDEFGVAHWCDDGTSNLDLSPSKDAPSAIHQLELVLNTPVRTASHSRKGELALQAVLHKIVEATGTQYPQHVPAVIFLYDDYSAMPKAEADHFVDELLSSTVTVYGLRDARSPQVASTRWLGGEQSSIAKYIATQTGGSYLAVDPPQFAEGLRTILAELHSRYELGLSPQVFDGKRHKLRVALSGAARKQSSTIGLRFRSGYMAVSSPTE
jgi:hypothetical protein